MPNFAQDTRFSHDPVHRHVTLSDGSPSLMGPQIEHQGWRENGMSTPRRAFNWWRPNRRRAAVIDAKRRQSTTGYPVDTVADKRESQSLRIRGSSLPPGDQARRTLPIDNEVKSHRLNARVPESSWPGVQTLGGAVWTNLHTLDTTLNIRRDDPRGYQRCFRQVPPVSWSNIQVS
ncbi:unnamed protein product [Dicrocoelium dendriticum]|nr:unnamed protein product [Dicrocoelium dendriticum]